MGIVLLRTIIIFAVLLSSMRLMGKRQLGELELSELVVAVLISDISANPLQDIELPLINGLLPAVTLLSCELLLSGAAMKSPRIRRLLFGKPSILVENGIVIQKAMRENRMTLDELSEELRAQSITDISTIRYAILETDGKLNTILYPDYSPVTPQVLNVKAQDPGYPVILIEDGRLRKENLALVGHDQKWLQREIKKRGCADASDVYLFSVNDAGQIYYLARER